MHTTRLAWLGILTACSDYQFASGEDVVPDDESTLGSDDGSSSTGGDGSSTTGGGDTSSGNDPTSDGGEDKTGSGGSGTAQVPLDGGIGGPDNGPADPTADDGSSSGEGATGQADPNADWSGWGWNDPTDPGIDGGHFDVDTSSEIAELEHGTTDGHVHEYDDKYDVTGIDAFAFLSGELHPITEDIPDADTPFVLIVANSDLSSLVRISINTTYDPTDATTYQSVGSYANTPLADLVPYSLSGANGTSRLTSLQLDVDPTAIASGGLQPTVTGCVRANDPGPDGEWRNGAITLQAVALGDDGTIATDLSMSAGGVQGVATADLLWEVTLFWHWDGPCFDDPDWATY